MSNIDAKLIPVEFKLPYKLIAYLADTTERMRRHDPKFTRDDLVANLLDDFFSEMVSSAINAINVE